MLDREGYGRSYPIVAICDHCGTMMPTGSNILKSAIRYMKSCGWRILKMAGLWTHTCSACHPKD